MFFPGGNGNMYQMRTKAGGVVPIVLTNASLGVRAPTSIPPRPLHDPMQDHAIVLYDPTIDERETDEEGKERVKEEERVNAIKEAQEKNKGLFNPHKNLRSLFGERQQKNQKQSKVLRPHQVEGVKVIIIVISNEAERSSGLVFVPLHNWNARGQPIWLYYGRRDRSRQNSTVYCALVDSSQIITTPCLVRNWANEFSESINPTAAITHTVPSLALDGKGTKAEMIERVQGWAMLIVSYELCARYSLTWSTLKWVYCFVMRAIALKTEGREMIFVRTLKIRLYVGEMHATDKDKQKWQEKLQEMSGLVTKFRIQRTNDLFEQTSVPLKAINLLKKLCNHPELLDLPGDLKGSDKLIPPDFSGPNDKAISRGGSRSGPGRGLIVNGAAKFVVLERVLHSIKTETKDKIVLISNYTQTLDLFERMLRSK
ncbi:Rad54 N terminal-domain-containing protein, partial [Hysterangium stoloniferum]